MDLFIKNQILVAFEKLFLKIVSESEAACSRGCDVCCTRNVSLTSLEAFRIAKYLTENKRDDLIRSLDNAVKKDRYMPKTTINGLAKMAIADIDPPDEIMDPSWGPCPFLNNKECSIYDVRPFHCQCMSSTERCINGGEASLSEINITINNIFLQYIEHLDNGGVFGNLSDMVIFFLNDENSAVYEKTQIIDVSSSLIKNSPMPALMIPPDHRQQVTPVMDGIQEISRRFF